MEDPNISAADFEEVARAIKNHFTHRCPGLLLSSYGVIYQRRKRVEGNIDVGQ